MRNVMVVVGGNSLVGGGIAKVCDQRDIPFLQTTRRSEHVSGNWIFLDFCDEESFDLPSISGPVIIVAAETDYGRCETDPKTREVNEEAIPRLTGRLLAQDRHVTLVSSNSIFGGDIPWPDESTSPSPQISYARQKSICEKKCTEKAKDLEATEHLTIVRLTKILDSSVPPLPTWISSWRQGIKVNPFADLIFAPMSLRYVSTSLIAIVESGTPGVFHLSGEENITYADFARALAEKLDVPSSLIEPTTAERAGVSIPFMPRYSGLAMNDTRARLGLTPQPLSSLIDDLCLEITNSG